MVRRIPGEKGLKLFDRQLLGKILTKIYFPNYCPLKIIYFENIIFWTMQNLSS